MDEKQQSLTTKDIKRAFSVLKKSDEAYALTSLLIQEVFFCNARLGGGSLAQNLGLIWFSPKEHWDVPYYVENMYHEALHQSLLLEDMVYGVFGDVKDLSHRDAQVTSNFLRIKRRFDLVFHGVFVAVELIRFYEAQGNTQKAESFIPDARTAITDMDYALARAKERNASLLSERGIEVYERMKKSVTS
jgi:hypothetical protein